jgi:uncharacterized protein
VIFWDRGIERIGGFASRVAAMSGSPASVAGGLAVGVAVACTPMIGLHLVLSIGIAVLTRTSTPAAILGSFAANPWTYPFTLAADYEIGSRLLGLDVPVGVGAGVPHLLGLLRAVMAGDWTALASLGPVFGAAVLGGVLLGIAAGALTYACSWRILRRIRFRAAANCGE